MRVIPASISLLLALAVGGALAADPAGRTPRPVVEKAAAGTQCVADPALMRRSHMDFLKHQRDDTVHGGIRGAKYSLKGCIDCHASRQTGSVVKAETNFCVSCHSYAAVKIDCFGCHASRPATAVAQGVRP
jgi:predicted CXXCH cytochrome family protein